MKKLSFLLLSVLIGLLTGCDKDSFNANDGTFTDSRDKHEYKWVRIGEQVWMAENLAYLPAINTTPEVSESEPQYYVYDYVGSGISEAKTTDNYKTYGVLYNWLAAKTACPTGWHLPTDAEWKILETYLGMSQADADAVDYRDSGSVGKALKFTSGWNGNGNGDNSSGFAALPGGYRGHVAGFGFNGIGNDGDFWSSSEGGSSDAWYRDLYNYGDGVYRKDYSRRYGFSVRCVKD